MENRFNLVDQGSSSAIAQQLIPNLSGSEEQNNTPTESTKTLASCDLCRRRKVKCDRAKPCSNCLRTGVVCISSTLPRVPKARQGGRRKPNGEILKRIAKLENLVKYLETENGRVLAPASTASNEDHRPISEASDSGNPSDRQLKSSITNASSPKDHLDRYLGSSFWVTLSEEVSGLREVLNDSSDEEVEDEDGNNFMLQNVLVPLQGNPQSFAIFGSTAFSSLTSGLEHPSLLQVYTLCSIFLTKVDPVFKVLHSPSLKTYLYGQAKDLECSPGPRGLEALRFAIYYAATTALSDEQCRRQIGEERSALLIRFRSSIELALARADFVNTVELSTLQALVIFLVSLRSNDTTRFSWTILSLAVRIATALGLHREESLASLRPFDRQMRRRLWWQIFVLDGQGALDRGSDPIITKSNFNTMKPSQVNDEDLNPEALEDPTEREAFTDMTFCLICQDVAEAGLALNFVPAGEQEVAQNEIASAWDQRRDFVISTQRRIQDKYLRYCDLRVPFHYFTNQVADIVVATLWLVLYRPLQAQVGYSTSFRPTNPNILRLSVEVLEKAHHVNIDPAIDSLCWMSNNYTQWHPLAVTLAELCFQTKGPLVERAWAAVDAIFASTERTVADSNTGMLWSPIRKLARRARSARQQYLQTVSAGPVTDSSDAKGALASSMQGLDSSMLDCGPGALYVQPETTTTPQYFSSSSAPTFDWDTWLSADLSGFQVDLANTNQEAWANWEGFVEDFRGRGT